MKIRKATIEDLSVIQNFNHDLLNIESDNFDSKVNRDYPSTKEGEDYFRTQILSETSIVLIAEIDDTPIGYLVGYYKEEGEFRSITKIGEISQMFVGEHYRGGKVGQELIDSFKTWCEESGVERLRVVASIGNQKAIKFYKRQGFWDHDIGLECDLNKILNK